jgi:putative endonuclease
MLPAMSRYGHWVYLVECRTGEIYVGQTADLARRIAEHNGSHRGARFTSGRRPVELRAAWKVPSLSDALRVEAFIRRGGRRRKETILADPLRLRMLLDRCGLAARVSVAHAPLARRRARTTSWKPSHQLGAGKRLAAARPRGEE